MLSETCPKCPEFVRDFVIQFSLIFGSEMHSAGMVKIGKKLSQGDIDTPSPRGGARGGVHEPESTRFFSLTNVWVVQFEQM